MGITKKGREDMLRVGELREKEKEIITSELDCSFWTGIKP